MTRERSCNKPAPENGGRDCTGSDTETQSCNLGTCFKCKYISSNTFSSLNKPYSS